MVKICSLSLWGCAYEYWSGALQNARLHKSLRSGYDVFIFTDIASLRQALIDPKIRTIANELIQCTTLIKIDRTPGYMGMFWRMLPFLWEDVERVIVRDADSILTSRELEAVRHWERSRHPFHIMRDHPAHLAAIMGGMFGGIVNTQMRKIFQPLKSLFDADRQYKLNTGWQVDQVFLKRYVFPLVSHISLIHDPFYDQRAFPTVRQGTEYVGDAVTRKKHNNEDTEIKIIEAYISGNSSRMDINDSAHIEVIQNYRNNLQLFQKGIQKIDQRYIEEYHRSGKVDLLDKQHYFHRDFE